MTYVGIYNHVTMLSKAVLNSKDMESRNANLLELIQYFKVGFIDIISVGEILINSSAEIKVVEGIKLVINYKFYNYNSNKIHDYTITYDNINWNIVNNDKYKFLFIKLHNKPLDNIGEIILKNLIRRF